MSIRDPSSFRYVAWRIVGLDMPHAANVSGTDKSGHHPTTPFNTLWSILSYRIAL
jgi:hypothetical protein